MAVAGVDRPHSSIVVLKRLKHGDQLTACQIGSHVIIRQLRQAQPFASSI